MTDEKPRKIEIEIDIGTGLCIVLLVALLIFALVMGVDLP